MNLKYTKDQHYNITNPMYLSTFEPISSLSQDNRRCIKGIHKMQTSSLLCEFIMLHAPESRVNRTVPSVNKSLWDIKSLASQILPPPGVKSMSRESVHFVFVPHQLRESKGLPVSTLHFQKAFTVLTEVLILCGNLMSLWYWYWSGTLGQVHLCWRHTTRFLSRFYL